MGFRTSLLVAFAFALWPALPVRQTAIQGTAVPFVGCKSDGQVGPVPAPNVPDRVIRLTADDAKRLTYYKAETGPGVLGPNGWACYGTYGSSGTNLFVTPTAFNTESLFSPETRIAGPAIQLSSRNADTSGRFETAAVVARVFPAHLDFVQRVIDFGVATASDFPAGPYPGDRLVYRTDRIVEYETTPRAKGLGTISRLQQDNDPIRGVAILQSEDPNLLLLTMRLPTGMSDLAPVIIRQVEQEP